MIEPSLGKIFDHYLNKDYYNLNPLKLLRCIFFMILYSYPPKNLKYLI